MAPSTASAIARSPQPRSPPTTDGVSRGKMTYTYKFIAVPVRIGATQAKHPDHPSYQDVVHEQAKQGWRFVQLVIECPAAVPTEYVLVFEQPME